MEDINIRVKSILDTKKLSQAQFSKKIDSTQQYISAVLKGNRKVGSNLTDRILKEYPDINKYWLLTGEGEMFNDGTVVIKPVENELPTGYYLPEVSAAAGMDKEMQNSDLKKIPVTIPGWEKDVIFINCYGDSMYPKYNSGEIIGVKLIEFQYLNYGYPYVVVLTNGDTYIKIIQPGSDNEHLLFVSTNEFYKPKEFHLSLIKSFYSIKGVIKKEMM